MCMHVYYARLQYLAHAVYIINALSLSPLPHYDFIMLVLSQPCSQTMYVGTYVMEDPH